LITATLSTATLGTLTRRSWRAVQRWAEWFRTVVRTIVGVPDYDRYLRHVRVAHPDVTPLSQDDFVSDQLQRRYNRPGSRCC
jgi:uncharacterized short protein YbdD (DUF466 family)